MWLMWFLTPYDCYLETWATLCFTAKMVCWISSVALPAAVNSRLDAWKVVEIGFWLSLLVKAGGWNEASVETQGRLRKSFPLAAAGTCAGARGLFVQSCSDTWVDVLLPQLLPGDQDLGHAFQLRRLLLHVADNTVHLMEGTPENIPSAKKSMKKHIHKWIKIAVLPTMLTPTPPSISQSTVLPSTLVLCLPNTITDLVMAHN